MPSPRSSSAQPRDTRRRVKSAPQARRPLPQTLGPHRRGRATSASRRDPRPSIPHAASSSDSSIPAPISAAPRATCGNDPLDTQRGSPSGNVQYHQNSASHPTSRPLDPVAEALPKIIDDASENASGARKYWARKLAGLFAGNPVANLSHPETVPHPAHRMGPDTLAQDNIRLTQTGASQVMSIHLHVNSPFLAPQDPTNANAAGWLRRTFKDSEEAEAALLADRPRFLQQRDILRLLPRDVEKNISNRGDRAQVFGFQELFIYLDRSSAADELRERIVAYYYNSPYLCGHLKTDLV